MNIHRPIRVLIVDNDELVTDALRSALECEGWEAVVASTAAEASAAVSPDVLVVNMMLPDAPGTDVVRDVRRAGSLAFVVCISHQADDGDRRSAITAGADDYIAQSFRVEDVVDRLITVARQLGLTSTSRRIGHLVLDLEAGTVSRRGKPLPLGSFEVELLHELHRQRGHRLSIGELTMAAARRGIRIPRELVARLLDRTRSVLAAAGSRALSVDQWGWTLA